ncbi:hypothetical protein [Pseudogemmobacter humi]|uniref:Uncharacterized protein n=1 Tax=Pseudogemmobacter humi TaxID=2483812 RepID=A0A3P5XHQ8_9RHOB|nr:hypothetical protein [Pseudogemmobacter humi]VDC28250.1 hypothetical protein XINFAN_02025 [Pseudogemmobacter humi]
MRLWYFETVSALGRWTPNTSPDRPDTVHHGGHLRIKTTSGMGPRVRGIVEVPPEHQDRLLQELHGTLSPDASGGAVAPTGTGDAA